MSESCTVRDEGILYDIRPVDDRVVTAFEGCSADINRENVTQWAAEVAP